MYSNMKAKITARLETSDHDGYCSGEECEYKCKIIKRIVNAPDQYKTYKYGEIDDLSEYDWEKLLEPPELGEGSSYCSLSPECEENNLGVHDYRYTIISVELGDEDDFNQVEKLDMSKIYED